MRKKSEITTAALFYILMAVVFTGILIFSLSQIDNLNKISKVKNIEEVKEEILDVITFCDDPLKKGSRKVFYIKANGFNEICFFGNDLEDYKHITNISKLETIYNTKNIYSNFEF